MSPITHAQPTEPAASADLAREQALESLHTSLDARWRPEDVAALLPTILDGITLSEAGTSALTALLPAPRPTNIDEACTRGCWMCDLEVPHTIGDTLGIYDTRSSMAADFARPVGAHNQLDRLKAAMPLLAETIEAIDADDPNQVETLAHLACLHLGKTFGRGSTRHDRLTASERKAAALQLSRRQYTRAFRAVAALEDKLTVMRREHAKRDAVLFSKSLLASRLPKAEFVEDAATAAFVAYYTSRRNLRTQFLFSAQVTPMDTLAEALLSVCKQSESTNWWAIAHVYTVPSVTRRLTTTQQGQLIGTYWNAMTTYAQLLASCWDDHRDANRMVVRPGDDSTTWNVTARAYNAARTGWFNLLASTGRLDILDTVCPPKAQALIAADVAAGHAFMLQFDPSSGKQSAAHGDTAMWATLPRPWEVLTVNGTDGAACTRTDVEAVAAAHGIDPAATGWTANKATGTVEDTAPTPELVHGVTVSSPTLARILRQAGWYSGR